MGHGVPELVLELNGQTWTLDPSRAYNLGRDPQGDVVIDDARVSWRHATVRWGGSGWLIEDHGSTNGTYVQGQRIQQLEIGPGTNVHLGNATDGPRLSLSGGVAAAPAQHQAATQYHQPQAAPAQQGGHWSQQPPQQQMQPPPGWQQQPQHHVPQQHVPQQTPQQHQHPAQGGGDRSPTTFHQFSLGRVMRIGRALENELVVSDLQVSRNHAEFRASPDGRFEIHDLGSHNGTYVNGQPLPKAGSAVITPQDTVSVGHSTFRLVGDRLEEFVDTGEVSFSARHLTVKVDNDKVILNNVTFGLPEKSLVAVIGPSGSGKSTLLRALTGYRPADVGEVLYDNRNLYQHFAELRQRIGLVPQDDILHKELTVRTALRYAARLRFPGDVADSERNARIEEVLAELKLDIHADKKITSLSGGQRKRVSVALELLTKPSLIFLDEPTSGLDPGMDRDVMQLLRGLADDGRTVLVVTHSVAELALCDKLLVMAPGGGVSYFGPPQEALNFFGYDTWADVFSAFENYRDYDWMGRWHGSQHYQMYAADIDAVEPQSRQAMPQVPRQMQKPQSWGSQFWTLVRRYLSVIASDRGFMLLSVLLPMVLGFVSTLMPSEYGFEQNPLHEKNPKAFNSQAGPILMIIAVGMSFSAAANAVRELIKERVIYERERATGLSRSAYLMSKVLVLTLITILQGLIICGIGFSTREMPKQGLFMPPAMEMGVAIVALGFTSMAFGLVISSLVKTAEKTMPLLVMFAIVQVVFTGTLFQLFGSPGLTQAAWLMPARWAVGAAGASIDLGHLMPPWDEKKPNDLDPLWEHSAGIYLLDMSMLILIGLICLFIVIKLLRRHEPEVMRK
ncbi:FHA domain-containing protein [Streptomyces oceani]|uniref:ABC transporter ATP-binding protein n=1 Tax=Streptomyces oceani TaxID=1075402 RepID=A0A1E7JZ18_9ACTN|nr:FHA domain-containing protein [Streptomyces oceani]OEU96836.1 ABC transporter ATP-binding protein [Streptomyces oceani]